MKSVIYYIVVVFGVLFRISDANGQTPSDAITMLKGDICFLAGYTYGTWDQYWEGTLLRTNGNIGTLTQKTINPGFAFGITDKVNLLFSIPYVWTSASGGQMSGVHGFQDFNFAIKTLLVERTLGKGTFYTLGTAAFETRATNYLSDYMPFSLGLGTNQFTLRAIAQYKFDMGLYFRGDGAYIWRTSTTAERDYYYNNGSYYTTEMDVPNAVDLQAVAGIWLLDDYMKIEGQYAGLISTSGDDIRFWNAGQPTNKSMFHKVGGLVQYYFKAVPGLGVLAYGNTVVGGRNSGKLTSIGAGITYQFSIY